MSEQNCPVEQWQVDKRSPHPARATTPKSPATHIRPRVEVVWARQELKRLTQHLIAAESALTLIQSDSDSSEDSAPTPEERATRAEIKRLNNKKRNLIRWLIGVGEAVSSEDHELAQRKPRSDGNRAPTKKKPKKNQTQKQKKSNTEQKKVSKGKTKQPQSKGAKAVWSGPSHGGRRRVRFVR